MPKGWSIDDGPGTGGWSQSGTLVSENPDKEVSLQVNFPKAASYTVQFGINVPTPIQFHRVEAVITWTVNGNSATRRVNVANGTSVTGTGEACKVVIRDYSATSIGNPTEYVVSVQIAPGERGSNRQPPTLRADNGNGVNIFTLPAVGMAAGTVTIPIPPDAGAISAFVAIWGGGPGAVIARGDIAIVQEDAAGGNIAVNDGLISTDWIPIQAGAVALRLDSFNALAFGVSVVFGIDG